MLLDFGQSGMSEDEIHGLLADGKVQIYREIHGPQAWDAEREGNPQPGWWMGITSRRRELPGFVVSGDRSPD